MAIPNILMQLAKNSQIVQTAKQMMNVVKTAQNPVAMLNELEMRNPQLKQAMDLIAQCGGDTDKAIRTVAEQNRFDPKEIVDMFKN